MEYIDFRSDTVTEPTMEMLDAMHDAKVGDDVYGDDETVNLLTKKIRISPAEFGEYRFVTHYWIDKKSIDFTIDSICSFLHSK